jgi:hypothetical protein
LKQFKEAGLTQEQILEKLFMRCLSRKPTEAETAGLIKSIAESGNPDVGLEDALWAILNSREFIFNH